MTVDQNQKKRGRPTQHLGTHLIGSHLVVALISLLTTAGLVAVLAPRFVGRMGQGHGQGPVGRGGGQGLGPQIAAAVQHALVWGLIAGIVTAVLLGIFASRRILSGINSIRSATRELADGHYDAELPQPATVELDALSQDIRTMADGLAETEKRRTRLISEVSHEMRTPLTVIDGQVEAMLDGVLPIDAENLAPITDESRRLRRLADDLSALSRAEEGRLNLQLARTNLSELLSGVVERLQPQADDAGLSLSCQPGDATFVQADADRITQVVTNLVGNAIRATPPGGSIAVSCATLDGQAIVRVTDTGEGLAEPELTKIFERFYRVPGRRSLGNETGSGIGLTIARELARQHGGELTAASPGPGQGATFTLTLPLAR